MKKIKMLKEELKKLAIEIRNCKKEYKNIQRNNDSIEKLWKAQRLKDDNQWKYRHMHIAYCLLRGRTMDQIENKVRDGNEPDSILIDMYKEQYHEEIIHTNTI